MSGGRRQSPGLFRWIITQSDSCRHCASAAPVTTVKITRKRREDDLRISWQELGIFTNKVPFLANRLKIFSLSSWPDKSKSIGGVRIAILLAFLNS
jgi:hypothetical protein